MEFRVSVRWAALGMVWAGQILTGWAAEPPSWETWQRGEWKAFVLEDPAAAEAFIDERFPLELSNNGEAVVNMAYALGLANYLKGQHASSIHWYELALNRPELKNRRTPWEDERAALGMESALWNNLGVNFEIIGEFAKAESALGESRRIDLELGEVRGAWTTAINQGLLLSRSNAHTEAISLLKEAMFHFEEADLTEEAALACLNLAVAEDEGDFTEAAVFDARKAVRLFAALGDSVGTMRAWVTLGQIHIGRSDFQNLRAVIDSMNTWRPEWLPPQVEFYEASLKANDCLKRGLVEEAESHMLRMEAFFEMNPGLRMDMDYLPTAVAIAVAKGDVNQAIASAGRFRQSVSDLFAASTARQLAEYRELNEREVQLIRIAQLESELRASRWLFVSFFLAALVLVVVWRAKRNQDRSNRVVLGMVRERFKRSLPLATIGNEEAADADIEQRLREIFGAIEDLVQQQRVHLNPNITLGELAVGIQINPRFTSLAIRQERGVGFSEFINDLRVQEAQSLLLDPQNHHLSFDQVAERCGFASTRTFYRHFTRFTGMTPGAFLRLAGVAKKELDSEF